LHANRFNIQGATLDFYCIVCPTRTSTRDSRQLEIFSIKINTKACCFSQVKKRKV